jgi:uncharacterized membrane protein YvlD (DUF360 family)
MKKMPRLVLHLTNFILKLVLAMLVLWVVHYFTASFMLHGWGVFSTALVVSVIGVIADIVFLERVQNNTALVIDFIVNTLIVWYVPQFWHGGIMNFFTALMCGIVLTIAEVGTHNFVLRSDKLLQRNR